MASNSYQSSKYYCYFVVSFITCYLTQQVLLNRFIEIGYGFITGGTFIYFCSPLIIDVVTEVYGYKAAKKLLWCGLLSLIFMALACAICIRTPYPAFWKPTADAYSIALGSVPRTAIVGFVTVFIGQWLNSYLISKWKILTRGRYFWMRSLGSSVFGDTITIVLATIGVFGGRVPPDSLYTKNLIPELIIMVSFTALGAIPAAILAGVVKKSEGIDNYDIGVDFNPFKLES